MSDVTSRAILEPGWAPFNLNDKVRVKLNEIGLEILKKDRAALDASILARNSAIKLPAYTPPKTDEDGWSEWQLWELMQKFGPHIHLGCKMPFSCDIEYKVAVSSRLMPSQAEIYAAALREAADLIDTTQEVVSANGKTLARKRMDGDVLGSAWSEELRARADKAVSSQSMPIPDPAPQVKVPPLDKYPYLKPREFLLFCSYCGDDNDQCTDARPCNDCLAMCNIYDEDGKYVREMGPPLTEQIILASPAGDNTAENGQ